MTDPTRRFSTRVENYIKYRPSYPQALLDLLKRECGLNSQTIVADLGSGTGMLAELLLREAGRVYAVEPNREMREAAERLMESEARFTSLAASAEATTLEDQSVDLITAGQAFHWFEQTRARREFARILKPGGWVVLVWNDRLLDASPFLSDYESLLLTYGTDYREVRHNMVADAEAIRAFFAPDAFRRREFPNWQVFDYASLEGRLLSSSYTPDETDARFHPMLRELRRIFELHNQGGKVIFEYQTLVYYGQLTPLR